MDIAEIKNVLAQYAKGNELDSRLKPLSQMLYYNLICCENKNYQVEGYRITPEEVNNEGKRDTLRDVNECYFVLSVEKSGQDKKMFVKFSGFWSSYEGPEYESDEFEIVEKKPVTRLEWVKS